MAQKDYWKLFYKNYKVEKKRAPSIIGIIATDDNGDARTAICGLLKSMLPETNFAINLDGVRLYIHGYNSSYRSTDTQFYFLEGTSYKVVENYQNFKNVIKACTTHPVPESVVEQYLKIAKLIFSGKPVAKAIREVEHRR